MVIRGTLEDNSELSNSRQSKQGLTTADLPKAFGYSFARFAADSERHRSVIGTTQRGTGVYGVTTGVLAGSPFCLAHQLYLAAQGLPKRRYVHTSSLGYSPAICLARAF